MPNPSLAKDPLEERDIQKILEALDDERVVGKLALVLVQRVRLNVEENNHGLHTEVITFKSEEKNNG